MADTARWRESFVGFTFAEINVLLEDCVRVRRSRGGLHGALAKLEEAVIALHQPATPTDRCASCTELWPCSYLQRIALSGPS